MLLPCTLCHSSHLCKVAQVKTVHLGIYLTWVWVTTMVKSRGESNSFHFSEMHMSLKTLEKEVKYRRAIKQQQKMQSWASFQLQVSYITLEAPNPIRGLKTQGKEQNQKIY